jgi:hypothetical protein
VGEVSFFKAVGRREHAVEREAWWGIMKWPKPFGDKNQLSTSYYVNEVLMLWNGNYEFKIRFYCLK